MQLGLTLENYVVTHDAHRRTKEYVLLKAIGKAISSRLDHDEVLRTIAQSKDWTKRYGVISNLIKNPRTPLALALNFVPRLNPRDLKTISVDKNVPEVIRKQALKFVRKTGKPEKGEG